MPKISKKTTIIINVILFLVLAGFLFFVWESDRGKKVPIQEEQVINNNENDQQTEDSEIEEVLEYKIYKNKDFGFEVKYPENWSIDSERSDENRVVFNIGKLGSIEAINFKKNEKKLSLDQIIKEKRDTYKQVIEKEEFLFIDNERVWKINTTEFGISRIFFIHNNFQYEIESMGYLDNEKILKEFNFLDE